MKTKRHIVVLVVAAMAGPITSSAHADAIVAPRYPDATCCAGERAAAQRMLEYLHGYQQSQEEARVDVDAAQTAYLACLERRRLGFATASVTVPTPVPVDCSFYQGRLQTVWAFYWNAAHLVSDTLKLWQVADARYRACLARIAAMRRCVLTKTGGSPVGSGASGTDTILVAAQTANRDAQGDVARAQSLLVDCRDRGTWPTFRDAGTGMMEMLVPESCAVELRMLNVAWTVYGTTRRYAEAQQVWQVADKRYRDCVAGPSSPGTCALPVNVATDGSDVSGTDVDVSGTP